jgi:hypothetical protein
MMLFVPVELFDALAKSITRFPSPHAVGTAEVELDGTYYAALFDRHGLRVASREGSPVTVGDILVAGNVPLESLPPHVRVKIDRAVQAKQERLALLFASRLPAVDVDAPPAD